MSSLTRSIQKRIFRKAGLKRETTAIDIIAGMPQTRRLKRGEGDIIDNNGHNYGRHYPQRLVPLEA